LHNYMWQDILMGSGLFDQIRELCSLVLFLALILAEWSEYLVFRSDTSGCLYPTSGQAGPSSNYFDFRLGQSVSWPGSLMSLELILALYKPE